MASGAPHHGALAIQIPVGPAGTAVAHPGETITTGIAAENQDELGDSLLITNIVYTAHLGASSVTSSNLLPAPVILNGFGDITTLVHNYVLPATAQDYLIAHIRVEGRDNFDGTGGSRIAQGFVHTVPGVVQILRPCIAVLTNNEDDQGENNQGGNQNGQPGNQNGNGGNQNGNGGNQNGNGGNQKGNGIHRAGAHPTAFTASVKNCGNCPLHNVIVSNRVNGVFSYVLGPTNLDVAQVIPISIATAQAAQGKPQAPVLFAWGTDPLGLSVSSSSNSDQEQEGDQGEQMGRSENQREHTTSPFGTEFASAEALAVPMPDAVFVYTMATGPGGATQVHPGEKVTIVTGIINLSEDLGTITVTNVIDRGRAIGNSVPLLSQPVTLTSFFKFEPVYMLEITNTYTVQAGDAGYLFDYAEVQGTFNFNGPNGLHVPASFDSIVGSQIRIVPLNFEVTASTKQAAASSGSINMRWASVPGKKYQVQYTTDLTRPNWQNLGNPIQATSGSLTTFDPASSNSRRFYRLILAP